MKYADIKGGINCYFTRVKSVNDSGDENFKFTPNEIPFHECINCEVRSKFAENFRQRRIITLQVVSKFS